MKQTRTLSGLAALACMSFAWTVAAQEPARTESSDADLHPSSGDSARSLLDEIDDADLSANCPGAERFGGTDTERRAYCILSDDDRRVTLRRLAEQALRDQPKSFRALFLMGYSQHVGETNLPKALYFLEEAERRLIDAYGLYPALADFEGLQAYRLTLLELVYVHGEMDHHEEKIRYIDALRVRLDYDYTPLKSWPLLKLKRFDEARQIAEDSLRDNASDPSWESVSLTALCAVYSEERKRQESYDACMRAAEPAMQQGLGGGVSLSNAAAAAMEMFRFDEAERLYNDATRRMVEATINPWGRLAHLYLRQGRFAEAVSALGEMRSYRLARPPYFDQQDQADAELTVAAVLLIAGRSEDALRITSRVVTRPDRQGTSSAAFEQNEAGNLITDRVARLDVARRLEERAVWSPWKEAWRLRLEAVKLRTEAWLAERRAASLLSDPERLQSSLRPECPGSVELPVWLDGEVVQIVRPGVALAAIEAAKKEETLPPELAGPVFGAFEAEALWLGGDDRQALETALFVVEGLAPVEALHRARVAAVGAAAAQALGDVNKAVGLFQQVLGLDPGVVRRLGLKWPVRIIAEGDGEAVRLAVGYLEDSPLFEVEEWGFGLRVSEAQVRLTLRDGSEVFRAIVRPGKNETPVDLARRIARAVHDDLFVPNVDISQADIRSLDGGLTGGGRASEKAKSVLDEVLGE